MHNSQPAILFGFFKQIKPQYLKDKSFYLVETDDKGITALREVSEREHITAGQPVSRAMGI